MGHDEMVGTKPNDTLDKEKRTPSLLNFQFEAAILSSLSLGMRLASLWLIFTYLQGLSKPKVNPIGDVYLFKLSELCHQIALWKL